MADTTDPNADELAQLREDRTRGLARPLTMGDPTSWPMAGTPTTSDQDPPAAPTRTRDERPRPSSRNPIVIEVDDRPIPVEVLGHEFGFVADLDARQMARTLGPIQEVAQRLADGRPDDTEGLAELVDAIMGGLADLLDDPTQRDDWLALRLPIPALIATDRPSVLGSLMQEWTGRPLDSA